MEIRGSTVTITIPPEVQLGSLYLASLVQWKGVKAALGVFFAVTSTFVVSSEGIGGG